MFDYNTLWPTHFSLIYIKCSSNISSGHKCMGVGRSMGAGRSIWEFWSPHLVSVLSFHYIAVSQTCKNSAGACTWRILQWDSRPTWHEIGMERTVSAILWPFCKAQSGQDCKTCSRTIKNDSRHRTPWPSSWAIWGFAFLTGCPSIFKFSPKCGSRQF